MTKEPGGSPEQQTSDSQLIGSQINQYRIEALIGRGGMGSVYLAWDSILERKVAIKMLSAEISDDAKSLSRFFQEAKAASALNHPNIITVYEIGKFEGTNYIVSEFIDGKTLSWHLENGELSLSKILEIATQISSALASAHAAGIVHRDVKPENVMIRNDGIVKVLDFGLAKVSPSADPAATDLEAATKLNRLTDPGFVIGTPQYMSPEQARGQKLDTRSDIFSFGIVLYEMIAGEPPFSGATKIDTIGSILKDEPPSLIERGIEVPETLDRLVEKSLRKDREKRYQHISDMHIDLTDIRQTEQISSATRSSARTYRHAKAQTTTSMVRERRFSLVHLIILFAALAVPIGAVAWWFWPAAGAVQDQLSVVEITSWASNKGEVYAAGAFSPDGKMIAFASTKSGTQQLWIKQTGAGEAIQVTKDEFRNERPIWSPTGEELAYFSTHGSQRGLWRIPILGGSPKLITEVTDGGSRLKYWSKNNIIYYQTRFDLFTVDLATGASKQITDFEERSIKADFIGISTDETRIAYELGEGDKSNLWLRKLDDADPGKVIASGTDIRNIVWHPDNKRILFSQFVNGDHQIFVTNLDGSERRQLSFSERGCLALDVSADGKNVLYSSAREESDIWGVNLKDRKEVAVATDIDSELWPDISADGKMLTYQAVKSLNQGSNLDKGRIMAKTLSSAEPAVEVSGPGMLPVFAPDGQKIAFNNYVSGKKQLAVVALGGGQARVLSQALYTGPYGVLPYSRVQTSEYQWSPDSSRIVFVSDQEGVSNVTVIGADGSGLRNVTSNSDREVRYACPMFSPDGKRIAFSSKIIMADRTSVHGIWMLDVESGEIRSLVEDKNFKKIIGWSPDGKSLLIVKAEKSEFDGLHAELSLIRVDIQTSQQSPVASLKDAYLFNIFQSRDGQQIAFTAHRNNTDDIWLIPARGGREVKLTENQDPRVYFSNMAWSPDGSVICFGKQTRYSLLSMLSNLN